MRASVFDQGAASLGPLALPDSRHLGFAAHALDRAAEHRDDDAWIASAFRSPDARYTVISADLPVFSKTMDTLSAWFDTAAVRALGPVTERIFLGLDEGKPRFGLLVAATEIERLKTRSDLMVTDMRSVAVRGLVDGGAMNAIATAKAMFFWHARHRFCGACGGETNVASAGWKRICGGCAAEHFPRTDPVVIMLAIDGDRCLMGRAPRFPEGMYSCLAGFMEPGETIEDAVRRETLEEAGITTGQVRYVATQPWPLPGSLMIGCLAQATSTEIRIDPSELADARWFSREEVRAILENRHPDGLICPPPMAIANHLMRIFASDG